MVAEDSILLRVTCLKCYWLFLLRRIRELAKEHNVPIVENAHLARTLYYKVEIDHPVPSEMYAATAQVIAFVYRLKRKIIA